MTRAKITAYVTEELSEALKRVAAVEEKSISDVVEDAIARRFTTAGHQVEQAAIMARLEMITRRLGVIEKGQETHFELSAHAARFTMSLAPDIPEADRPALNARGAERFRNLMGSIITRLAAGRSVWREQFLAGSAAAASRQSNGAGAQ